MKFIFCLFHLLITSIFYYVQFRNYMSSKEVLNSSITAYFGRQVSCNFQVHHNLKCWFCQRIWRQNYVSAQDSWYGSRINSSGMKRLKNPRNVLFPFFFILQFFHQSTEGFLIVLDSMVGSRSLSFCFSFSEKKHSVDWGKSFSQSAGKKMGLLGTNKTISVTQLQSHLRLLC